MDQALPLLLCCLAAALVSALGTLPVIRRERVPLAWLGWANSIAAGLMLGAAYALAMASLDGDPLSWAGGAVAGVLSVYATHAFVGTSDLDLNVLNHPGPEYGYQVLTIQALHSAAEGVAIGIAAVIDLRFGFFLAFVLAVHNIAEAMVLSAVLRTRQVPALQSATLVVAATMSQVLMAVIVFIVVSQNPSLIQLTLGYAVGTVVYLVMVELLPEAYKQAGAPSIAILTSLAIGAIAFLEGVVL